MSRACSGRETTSTASSKPRLTLAFPPTALYWVKLAGIVGLSCWLPLDSKFPSLVQESDLNHETPIYMAHGTVDRVVPTAYGQMSYDALKKQNFAATMKLHPGMASIRLCDEELNDVEAFPLLASAAPGGEEFLLSGSEEDGGRVENLIRVQWADATYNAAQ
ncbi:hypothetical protein NUW58_g10096 [Xylaria curta]|uniref:Uncharacterized protein n=1 Tax=Xylaria curta TaxID=42375 RepID=A0ACC1MPP7_9PEZI|nr:hypothetical protein NUW58_g10096 [Xylaria curta]